MRLERCRGAFLCAILLTCVCRNFLKCSAFISQVTFNLNATSEFQACEYQLGELAIHQYFEYLDNSVEIFMINNYVINIIGFITILLF